MKLPEGRTVFVVPKLLQGEISDIFHKSLVMGGHLRITATRPHIKRYFFGEKKAGMIESYCATYEACIAGRNQSGKVLGSFTLLQPPHDPLMKVYTGPLCSPLRVQGYKQVLVVMDAFTKFIFTYPLKSSHSKLIVSALTHIFANFGQPALSIVVNGSEFHHAR